MICALCCISSQSSFDYCRQNVHTFGKNNANQRCCFRFFCEIAIGCVNAKFEVILSRFFQADCNMNFRNILLFWMHTQIAVFVHNNGRDAGQTVDEKQRRWIMNLCFVCLPHCCLFIMLLHMKMTMMKYVPKWQQYFKFKYLKFLLEKYERVYRININLFM